MGKLPFVAGIFWKVLVVVAVLVVATFVVLVKFTDYVRTTTDTVGATITSIIFSYLLHLWMLPAEYLHPDEEYDAYEEAPDDGQGQEAGELEGDGTIEESAPADTRDESAQ